MRAFFQSPWFTIVVLIAVVASGLFIVRRIPLLASLHAELRNVKDRIASAEVSQEGLAAKKEFMQSDAYRERQARITLHYKKPDERVVYVYYSDSVSALPTPTPNPEDAGSWWERLTRKILGR